MNELEIKLYKGTEVVEKDETAKASLDSFLDT